MGYGSSDGEDDDLRVGLRASVGVVHRDERVGLGWGGSGNHSEVVLCEKTLIGCPHMGFISILLQNYGRRGLELLQFRAE